MLAERENILQFVRQTLDMKPLFFDTETTGLKYGSEIVELAIVDLDGVILFDDIIKPVRPIPPEATGVHHISNADVASRNGLEHHWSKIREIVDGRLLVSYNIAFDVRLLIQSMAIAGIDDNSIPAIGYFCAMTAFSQYKGDIRNGSYRFHSLSKAAEFLGITLLEEAHRAWADAKLCRQIMLKLAELEKVV